MAGGSSISQTILLWRCMRMHILAGEPGASLQVITGAVPMIRSGRSLAPVLGYSPTIGVLEPCPTIVIVIPIAPLHPTPADCTKPTAGFAGVQAAVENFALKPGRPFRAAKMTSR